jgi:hypothetical protein
MAAAAAAVFEGEGRSVRPKRPWTASEDALLRNAYMEVSSKNPDPIPWADVAPMVPDRNSKQCRERWVHHLAPEVIKAPWTEEEDQILFDAMRTHRTAWSAIAKLLPGRSDHCIKNRYYSTMRRIERKEKKKLRAEEAGDAAEGGAEGGGAGADGAAGAWDTAQFGPEDGAHGSEEVEEEAPDEEEGEGGGGGGDRRHDSASGKRPRS